MKKKFLWFVVMVVSICLIGGFSFVGCKEEITPTEEEVAEETEEVAEETEEVAEETEEVAEEEVVLGTESATYWVEKAGIKPSGEITIYSYKDEDCTEYRIAEKYMEAYPEVTVNWNSIPGGGSGYFTTLTLETEAGNEGFDLYWTKKKWVLPFMNSLEDVTDRIPEELKNDIPTSLIREVGYENPDGSLTYFGLPLFAEVITVVYNKDLLEEAGYSAPPETWDEFFEAAEVLTKDENNDGLPEIYGYTSNMFSANQYIQFYSLIIKSVGGQFWNEDKENPQPMFNNEAGKRALQILKESQVGTFVDPSMKDGGNEAAKNSLASKQTAMGIMTVGNVYARAVAEFPDNVDNLGWSLLPHDEGYPSYTNSGAMGFVIGNKSENVDAALGYILFYSSPEMMKFMTKNYGPPPSRISIAQDEEFIKEFPYVSIVEKQSEHSSTYDELNAPTLFDKCGVILENYFSGAIDEQVTLDQMEDAFIEVWKEGTE